MGTQVLRPHDCLPRRLRPPSHAAFIPRRNPCSGQHRVGGGFHAIAGSIPEPKKEREVSPNHVAPRKATHLRRGQSLDAKTRGVLFAAEEKAGGILSSPRCGDLIVGPSADVYAGAAFWTSPSPRALPVPAFLRKDGDGSGGLVVVDLATRDLRRLLQLE